jgi:NTP pyrophosphatase (non-canonical NTP hydrolase)
MNDPITPEALSSPAELARWVETHHGDHPEWVDELRSLLPRAPGPARSRQPDLDAIHATGEPLPRKNAEAALMALGYPGRDAREALDCADDTGPAGPQLLSGHLVMKAGSHTYKITGREPAPGMPLTGLTRNQAAIALRRLGYRDHARTSLVLHLARENGQHLTTGHLVSFHGDDQDGGYDIIPASQVTHYAIAAMSREETENALRAAGYPEGAIRQAIEHAPYTSPQDGPAFLSRHSVTWDGFDAYRITDHGPAEAGRLRAASGHELVEMIIAKHGTDRFPTAPAQYRHAADELGELGEAMMNWYESATMAEPAAVAAREHIRKELGDVGLCVYGLAAKLGENLDEAMAAVVRDETRSFVITDGDLGEETARGRANR